MSSLQGIRLLENTLPREGRHFVRFRLKATKSQHHALDAEVVLTSGGVTQRDFVKMNAGFQTQVPLDLHFGLGASEAVTKIEVRWPSGTVETHEALPADRLIHLTEGKAPRVEPVPAWPASSRPRAALAYDLSAQAKPLEGEPAPLADSGAPVVVNFWAPWCKPCQDELPALAAVSKRFGDRARFVGVSVELEDTKSVEAAVAQHGLTYAQFYANPPLLESFFGGDGEAPLPSTFVFDRAGKIRRVFHRPVDEADLTGLLENLDDEGARPRLLANEGEMALMRGELELARRAFERALAIDPKAPYALAQLGTTLSRQKKYKESIAVLRRAVEVDPTLPYGWYRLGWSLKLSGDLPGAIEAHEEAVALKPEAKDYALALADALTTAKKPGEALAVLERAAPHHPKAIDVWMSLGRLRLGNNDPAAADAFSHVLQIAPGHPEAVQLLRQTRRPR